MTRYHGSAAAPGQAQGPACRIGDDGLPADFVPGAILVSRVVHPYMAPLFQHCGGVVVETGGLLQHVVILAREFGIPAVVGVENAVDRFTNGTLLRIDGDTGLVAVDEANKGLDQT